MHCPGSARHIAHRRKERSDKGKRHDQPEARLQRACVAYLRQHACLAIGSAAGAKYQFGAKTAVAMKAKGLDPGQPDLLVLERGVLGEPGLAVEFKIDTNELSPEQRYWFKQLRQRGWRCAEVRTTDDFHHVLKSHLGRWLPPFGAVIEELD